MEKNNLENNFINIKKIFFDILYYLFFIMNNYEQFKKNCISSKNELKDLLNFFYLLKKGYESENYLEIEQNFFSDMYLKDKSKSNENTFKKLLIVSINQFSKYYNKNFSQLKTKYKLIKKILNSNDLSSSDNKEIDNKEMETIAKIISEIFLPELTIKEDRILKKWEIKIIEKSSDLIKPEDFIIQLNALYTLSSKNIYELKKNLKSTEYNELLNQYIKITNNPGEKIGIYDHPVEIFCEKEKHELLNFLEEFDKDIDFEKSKNVFKKNYKVPLVISISTTHKNLENLISKWLKIEIKKLNLKNLNIFILDNKTIEEIKNHFLKPYGTFDFFTVEGNYSNHFNALKYIQLFFEKGLKKTAGFKLDTDEGIKSKDLYSITSRTWFQTLCNKIISSSAIDSKGNKFKIHFIIGEYINNIDIIKNGYKNAIFLSDVKPPRSFKNNMIFFNKAFVHAKTTSIYNKHSILKFNNNIDSGSTYISHPVVKGGGYGIVNTGLKNYTPFSPSFITRAEDQAFYYTGFSEGIRGLFIETLRIAHYKEKYSYSEKKTEIDRLIEDMHRLILFSELGKILDKKDDLDPMPGAFISYFPFTQSFFTIIYNTFLLIIKNEIKKGIYLYTNGLKRLEQLTNFIEHNDINKIFNTEKKHWECFIKAIEKLKEEEVKNFLNRKFI